MNVVVELEEYLSSSRALAFSWGTHDCVLWCARWLDRKGDSYETRLRERYPYCNVREALRIIRQAGGYRGLVSEFLGQPKPPLTLGVGDIVRLNMGRRDLLGIKAPSQALAIAPQGCIAVALDFIVEGWGCPL